MERVLRRWSSGTGALREPIGVLRMEKEYESIKRAVFLWHRDGEK
jgi:hypothetical protein